MLGLAWPGNNQVRLFLGKFLKWGPRKFLKNYKKCHKTLKEYGKENLVTSYWAENWYSNSVKLENVNKFWFLEQNWLHKSITPPRINVDVPNCFGQLCYSVHLVDFVHLVYARFLRGKLCIDWENSFISFIDTQIHKYKCTNTQYTNTVLVKLSDTPIMWYIFEKVMVRGLQKQCSQVKTKKT